MVLQGFEASSHLPLSLPLEETKRALSWSACALANGVLIVSKHPTKNKNAVRITPFGCLVLPCISVLQEIVPQ